MSLQTIFEISESFSVNNRRVVGQQQSRSGQMRVAQYLTSVPWQFTVKPHSFLYYPQVRDVIQAIDNYDRQLPQTISFASTNLQWFTVYQGDITSGTITLAATPAANTQTLSIAFTTGAGYAFKAGDFIMVGSYTYKVTANVVQTTSPANVTIHRPVIGSPSSGATVYKGTDCTFSLLASQCPTYTLNPMTNGAFVQWDGDFVFIEDITG